MAQLKLWKFFSVLMVLMLIASVGAVVVPASPVEANDGQTLNVAKWTGPTTLTNVSGRSTVIKVDSTYHMWYSPSDSAIYHTSSNGPTDFAAGAQCTFDTPPKEVGSVTILEENDIFYMIAYEKSGTADATKKFAIYTSPSTGEAGSGTAWTYAGLVFGGTGLPDYNKIDGPYLFKDGTKYRLYFQVKTPATSPTAYNIYTAEASGTLASIAASGEAIDFTLANSNNPVLTPGDPTKWDGAMVMQPCVVKDGDVYYMWYSAHNGTGTPQMLGLAYSSNGYTWTKSRGNPIIPDASNGFGEPSVIKDGNIWRMWAIAVPPSPAYKINYYDATGPFEFSSIHTAVTAASAGDTTNVAPGTYTENVTINNKGDLTITGAGAGSTVIEGTLSFDTATNGAIRGLDFLAVGSTDSLVLKNVNGFSITNCNFDGNKQFLNGGRAVQMNSPCSSVTIENCEFKDGYYVTIQGYVNNLTVKNSTITNCKSGINLQNGDNLVVENTDISVIAQGTANDTYCVRFASDGAGSGTNMNITGGTFSVNKNNLTASSGTYHSAIIIREGAAGTLKANWMNIDGEVVNLSSTQLDATNNWWGDASGPTADTNPDGKGNKVSGNVTFNPWLVLNFSADPISILADETSFTTLTATVKNKLGNPVADGTNVVFTTSKGKFDDAGSTSVTKQTTNGVATANLTSISSPSTVIADITATVIGVVMRGAVFFQPSGAPPSRITRPQQ